MLSPDALREQEAHYVKYAKYFEGNEKRFLDVTKDILRSKGEQRRRYTKTFELLRPHYLNYGRTPHCDDVFNGADYTAQSKNVMRSQLRKCDVVDHDGFFTDWFFMECVRRIGDNIQKRHEFAEYKRCVEVNGDIPVDMVFDYTNTMDTLRKNPYTVYGFSSHLNQCVRSLDYTELERIQIIKLNHVGGNPRIAIPLAYHYSCVCGNSMMSSFERKDLLCDHEECGRKMTRSPSKDLSCAGYVSQVITDDFNDLPIISLVPVPSGEFNAAVFLRNTRSGYHLFMISVDDVMPNPSSIELSPGEHVVWQLISKIDAQHDDRLGKHIHGMDWYKAAILLSYLANLQGYTSANVLAIGEPGVGKTSTPRFCLASITQQFKIQEAISLSGPGLYGSTAQLKVNDSTVTVPEAGLLSRYNMVVIDEVYMQASKMMPLLRSVLRSSMISKEVAGNRTSLLKSACVIGTSNPLPQVTNEQKRFEFAWIRDHDDGVHTPFSEENAHGAMINEWHDRGLDWHTGQPYPDVDRWMILFFIRNRSRQLDKHHLDAHDTKISDIVLSKLLYNPAIHDYFTVCSKIQVNRENDSDRILDFVNELRKHDTIHSNRVGQDITLLLELSAQINGRSVLTDMDFDFVRELWSKTCEWVDVSELSHAPTAKYAPPAEWTIETIKKLVHTEMKEYEGIPRYYMRAPGFAMITAKLEDMGAPAGLVESTVEHYRQNPN